MTTAKAHRFEFKKENTKEHRGARERALDLSEKLNSQWEFGYGIVFGPFLDDKGMRYYEVAELIESK